MSIQQTAAAAAASSTTPVVGSKLIQFLAPYSAQASVWPRDGRRILATYDDDTIVVYQAFNKSIAEYAVRHQTFQGAPDYSPTRMTWIKTNFLWMMYRSDWARRDKNQSNVLALRLTREGFDEILRRAVGTTEVMVTPDAPFKRRGAPAIALDVAVAQPATTGQSDGQTDQSSKESEKAMWAAALSRSDVRLQWDPDHSPCGAKMARRAIQLGVKGQTAQEFVSRWIVAIEDVTESLVKPAWALLPVEPASKKKHRRSGDGRKDGGASSDNDDHSDCLVVPIVGAAAADTNAVVVGGLSPTKKDELWASLWTPLEREYVPSDPALCAHIGLD